ncbi:methylated-DNA--[protein]-cysteine S-methyltransferase [Novilysobacter avium]|uniref:Methylated-DNA--protein-cysteine methyltransferase n=1 Tax=Novilysobacter avium TaxID=2781023 RepID=A0A7S6ZUZ9_9GAMM|nr:methylated-DNA--[protein]-cysteine S-methyltransferase [Lysobacter avium]QOW22668.1 methylated-DNA--[protein]-cysteine S-methyltransferase [Lysobacter avium]
MIVFTTIDSPVGPLLLAADADGLRLIEFSKPRHPVKRGAEWQEGSHPTLDATRTQLDEYFAGRRTGFDLPLSPQGTLFQRDIWAALAQIPYGQTVTYGDVASRAGHPGAVRAVGAAVGRNPVPIVVPCHRVVGTDGSMTGFSGGLPVKRQLLVLEGAVPA